MNDEQHEQTVLYFNCEACNTRSKSAKAIAVFELDMYIVWQCDKCYKTCRASISMEELFALRTVDVAPKVVTPTSFTEEDRDLLGEMNIYLQGDEEWESTAEG